MSLIKKRDQGFVMMESLISLSILALFIGTVFPFSLEVLTVREQVKTEVELSRFLYESALFHNKEEPETKIYTSGKVLAQSIETRKGIQLYYEDEKVRDLTFVSVQW